MDAKTVYDKTVFTREEVARAYNAADGEIIGASLIMAVELKMELFNLSEIRRTDLSDSERECIEWGLINEVI
jgi:tryptophan synthase alpha subunit